MLSHNQDTINLQEPKLYRVSSIIIIKLNYKSNNKIPKKSPNIWQIEHHNYK